MISQQRLQELVMLLKQGGLIAFPTETVYALAGDAKNVAAVKRIFKLKGRPITQPISVLLPKNYNLLEWANAVPTVAQQLADYFWPGPLTLVFNKNPSVLSELTGGGTKIGLRVPDHPIAQALLQAFGTGLAAPSANISGQLSTTQCSRVQQTFANALDAIIDGDGCSVGIESTIVDVSSKTARILRLGAISHEVIHRVTNGAVNANFSTWGHIPLRLSQIDSVKLKSAVYAYLNQGESITVLARQSAPIAHPNLTWVTMPKDSKSYARTLYQRLHAIELHLTTRILIESLPVTEEWAGIRALLNPVENLLIQ